MTACIAVDLGREAVGAGPKTREGKSERDYCLEDDVDSRVIRRLRYEMKSSSAFSLLETLHLVLCFPARPPSGEVL